MPVHRGGRRVPVCRGSSVEQWHCCCGHPVGPYTFLYADEHTRGVWGQSGTSAINLVVPAAPELSEDAAEIRAGRAALGQAGRGLRDIISIAHVEEQYPRVARGHACSTAPARAQTRRPQ
eukprot:4937867-Lingulodinium_polyedra.AAC.1